MASRGIPWWLTGRAPPDSGIGSCRCSSLLGLQVWSKCFIVRSAWWCHCQFACSHGKLALAVRSLPTRETGPVTLGRHLAPGVTRPCRQRLETWALRLHVSLISAVLPTAVQQFSTSNPSLSNTQVIFPICSKLGCDSPYRPQHLSCRDSSTQVFTYWVLGSPTSFGKS